MGFKKFGYPQGNDHTKQHAALLQEVVAKLEGLKSGNYSFEFPIQLLNYLQDWLEKHILKSDADYVSLFKQHASKIPDDTHVMALAKPQIR